MQSFGTDAMSAPKPQRILIVTEGLRLPGGRVSRVRPDPRARGTLRSGPAGLAALLLGLVALLLTGAALPPSLHASLLLRLRSYDRRVGAEAPLHVLLVDDGLERSRAFHDELEPALRAASKGPTPASIQRGTLGPGFAPVAAPGGQPLLVVVAPGLDARIPELRAALGALPVLTVGSDEASVRAGLALGIVREDDHPAVLVHRAAAQAEGARLDAGLLRLAHTVDAPRGSP